MKNVRRVEPLVLSCKFKVRFREMWSSAFIVGCQFKSLKTRQRRQRVQRVQLLVCGKVLQMSFKKRLCSFPALRLVWHTAPATADHTFPNFQLSAADPTFNFRPPPPSDRQEVQLSAQRGLPVIRGGDTFMHQLLLQVPPSEAGPEL